MDWQPIETAPKDKPILGWMPDNDGAPDEVYVLIWQADDSDVPGEWGYWREAGGEYYQAYKPTMWTPVPKPPTETT